jgi:hypothetical protein
MAAGLAKKFKRIQPPAEAEDSVEGTGLWIEPSLLPTRLAQRGMAKESVRPLFEQQSEYRSRPGRSPKTDRSD